MTSRLLIAVLAVLFVQDSVLACGDSLHRVGKGVAYRTYSAPAPANLLMLADTKHAYEIAHGLAAAGHSIVMVETVAELKTRAGSGDFQVIVAPLDDVSELTPDPDVQILPVAEDKDQLRIAKRGYDQSVRSDRALKYYLKAIHLLVRDA